MNKKFNDIVHAWEINGFANINKKIKDSIKNQLLKMYGSYQKTSLVIGKITGVSISYFLRNAASFMKISNIFRITSALNISKNVVEENTIAYRDHNS
jgi:hypothetical protein